MHLIVRYKPSVRVTEEKTLRPKLQYIKGLQSTP